MSPRGPLRNPSKARRRETCARGAPARASSLPMETDSALYFAYGSNMKRARLCARVGDVELIGVARLEQFEFVCNKRGTDGSAKANIVRQRDATVWGVVWRVRSSSWPTLDRFEGGYTRELVEVELSSGARVAAATYRSTSTGDKLAPFTWYKTLMIEGARERGLPPAWVERLSALDERPDPRRPRTSHSGNTRAGPPESPLISTPSDPSEE